MTDMTTLKLRGKALYIPGTLYPVAEIYGSRGEGYAFKIHAHPLCKHGPARAAGFAYFDDAVRDARLHLLIANGGAL